jgi:hypothetical protein
MTACAQAPQARIRGFQIRVIVDDVIDKLALRQKAQDHLHRNPHAADNRFPEKIAGSAIIR